MKKKPAGIKSTPAKSEDSGAPAVLRRLEADALEYTRTIDDKKAELVALRAVKETAAIREKIARAEMELASANDEFVKTAKVLLAYDKSVKEDRREGEKILVSDVKEIFAQFQLSESLALESYIITIAQGAALCGSPEEFHALHAENIRAARAGALDAAKREGVIPAWLA
jgi:hypothetical protein